MLSKLYYSARYLAYLCQFKIFVFLAANLPLSEAMFMNALMSSAVMKMRVLEYKNQSYFR